MSNKTLQSGIVLRVQAVRDADLIVTILSEQSGALSALARSARKSKKRFMGGLDIFSAGIFELSPAKGSSDLLIVDSLSDRVNFSKLRDNLSLFPYATLCAEVASHFAHEGDPEGRLIYQPLMDVLARLNAKPEEDARFFVVLYLLRTLALSGFHPLHSDWEMKPEIREWWNSIFEKGRAHKPEDSTLINESFVICSRMAEEICSHKLHSLELIR